MHLAYRYGANRIWIVNVGDLKPMEFPIEMFLDYAWNPELLNQNNLQQYSQRWAEQQFGSQYAKEIATILDTYTKFNSRRKHELITPTTYSLVNYKEAETVVKEYNALAAEAERISKLLPAEYKDAYYQLVLHPVKASAVLNELHITTGRNHLYAAQGRAATNDVAEKVKSLFAQDAALSLYYNKIMANGKWDRMMDQTHISYTYWQQPPKDILPALKQVIPSADAEMGVSIEGSEKWWPNETAEAVLPDFDSHHQQSYYLEIFNRGNKSYNYSITSPSPILQIDQATGTIEKEKRIWVSVDWKKVSTQEQEIPLTISGPNGTSIVVKAVIKKPELISASQPNTFIESNGYVSMEAEHFSKAVNGDKVQWQRIPNLGRTLSSVSAFPVTAAVQTPANNSPHLEYSVQLMNSGEVKVNAYLSPTLDFHNKKGFKYAISFDDEPPQIVNMHADFNNKAWEKAVSDNVLVKVSTHQIKNPGLHTLKFWMVDPAVVLQKIVVETTGVKPSYLGPPESFMTGQKSTSSKLPK
jgi:hypothetical protein